MIEIAIAAAISCNLVSQNIDKDSDDKDRMCVYKCQNTKKPEIVYTDPIYWCPKQLYVKKKEVSEDED